MLLTLGVQLLSAMLPQGHVLPRAVWLQTGCEQQAPSGKHPCLLCIHMSLTLLSVCSLAVRSGPRRASVKATQAT